MIRKKEWFVKDRDKKIHKVNNSDFYMLDLIFDDQTIDSWIWIVPNQWYRNSISNGLLYETYNNNNRLVKVEGRNNLRDINTEENHFIKSNNYDKIQSIKGMAIISPTLLGYDLSDEEVILND